MRKAAVAQGLFYVLGGLWPILHAPSFEAVTGRKRRERWLVQTTGGLIAAVGLALLVGSRERRNRSLKTLGIASAAALGTGAAYFASTGRISRIYLGDAAAEAATIAGWILD